MRARARASADCVVPGWCRTLGAMKDRARQEILQQLARDAGPVQGSDLAAHLARDVVLVVAPTEDLVACALAVATDDTARVQAWLDAATLRRPTAEEHARWPTDEQQRWTAVVVRPFVLVQLAEARAS